MTQFAASKLRSFTYSLFNSINEYTWVDLPEQAIKAISNRLNFTDFDYYIDGDKKYPKINSSEGYFLGPSIGESFSCSASRIKRYRSIFPKHYSTISDEHIGLIHNVIIRYHTELSSFPYLHNRTNSLSSDDVFVDIGAFRGYLTLKACKISNVRVITYEPINENAKIIDLQLSLNKISNVELNTAAVSLNEESEINFYRSFDQINSEINKHVKNKHTKTINVQNESVDNLLLKISNLKPRKVHFSITTNGTEIGICHNIIEKYLDYDLDVEKIVVPILYTKEIFSFEKYLNSNSFLIDEEYPWAVIRKRN